MATNEEYTPPKNGWRTFLALWATQSISVFGSALTFFSVTVWLTTVRYPTEAQKPELSFALAAIGLAFGLPHVFLAPIAGAWADRHDRKRTMITADLLSGVLSAILLVLMLFDVLQIWMIVILAVGFAVGSSFHYSSFDTSYAMLVPEEKLPRANGMMQTIWALSAILSPLLAAFIITLPGLARQGVITGAFGDFLSPLVNGAPLAIGLDIATFLIAAITPIFLFIPSPKRTDLVSAEGKKKSMWADIKEGGRYILNRRPLLWLLATFTAINFATAPMGVFQPLMVKFNLAPDWTSMGFTFETALAALTMAAGIGGVVGGIFISTWGGLKRRRVYGVVLPIMAAGLMLVVFGLSPWFYLSLAAVLMLDGLTPIMNAHSQTIWQTQTPRHLQGRVFSVRRLIAQFTAPMGTALAGLAGGFIDPGVVMAILGTLLVVFCVAQMFNPQLLHVEDKAYMEGEAAKRGDKYAQTEPEPALAASSSMDTEELAAHSA
jgi:DHA3 family macrolide efflux protein-like MFS transporter